jgi:nitrate/nitrite-specific signal transduction histidine kinase
MSLPDEHSITRLQIIPFRRKPEPAPDRVRRYLSAVERLVQEAQRSTDHRVVETVLVMLANQQRNISELGAA